MDQEKISDLLTNLEINSNGQTGSNNLLQNNIKKSQRKKNNNQNEDKRKPKKDIKKNSKKEVQEIIDKKITEKMEEVIKDESMDQKTNNKIKKIKDNLNKEGQTTKKDAIDKKANNKMINNNLKKKPIDDSKNKDKKALKDQPILSDEELLKQFIDIRPNSHGELYCDLCDEYFLISKKHWKEFKHRELHRLAIFYIPYFNFSIYRQTNFQNVENLEQALSTYYLISDEEKEDVHTFVNEFNDDLYEFTKNDSIQFVLDKSYLNDYATKFSDVNLCVLPRDCVLQIDKTSHLTLDQHKTVCKFLKKNGYTRHEYTENEVFFSHVSEFNKLVHVKVPCCIAKIGYPSTIIAKHLMLNENAKHLCGIIRRWFSFVGLSDSAKSDFITLTLPVMVIHYFQMAGELPRLFQCYSKAKNIPIEKLLEIGDIKDDEWFNQFKKTYKSKPNNKQISHHFFGILHYYIYGFCSKNYIVSIHRAPNEMNLDNDFLKMCFRRPFFVENPFIPSEDLMIPVGNDFFMLFKECWFITYKKYYCLFYENTKSMNIQINYINRHTFMSRKKKIESTQEFHRVFCPKKLKSLFSKYITGLVKKINFNTIPNVSSFFFENVLFKQKRFCGLCYTTLHSLKDCKLKLPMISKKFLNLKSQENDKFMWEYYHEMSVSQDWIKEREDFCKIIQDFLCESYGKCKLQIFGSSLTGFAEKNSDLDISITMEDKEKQANHIQLLEEIMDQLKNFSIIQNITFISTARIPILTFNIQSNVTNNLIACDLSAENFLAFENSLLLKTYCLLDKRVAALCFWARLLMKAYSVSPSKKGGLSSYAINLMVIYYLQTCEPRILPSLQKLVANRDLKAIGGQNLNFERDLVRIEEVFADLAKNEKSLYELWIDYCYFYANQFDVKNLVVSIRVGDTLPKFKKFWNNPYLAIEDPFILERNLVCRQKRKKFFSIKRAFVLAYNQINPQLILKKPNDLFGLGFKNSRN